MSGVFLYPRLPRSSALGLLRQFEEMDLGELRMEGRLKHPQATFNPVGGRRVSPEHLSDLQREMHAAADSLGFPDPLGARTADFDRDFMALLHDRMRIVPGDAGQEGVWSFLSLLVVPELPPWRFPSRSEERILGRPRNTFRRLWWRAEILGAGPEGIADELTEDQLVQIEERPTLGGDPRIASAIARSYIRLRDRNSGVSDEALMREGAKRLIRLTPHVDVHGLSDDDLRSLTDEVMDRAAEALQNSEEAGRLS